MEKIISILLLTVAIIQAQLDTTNYYPLHIGDKWEYYSSISGYSQVEVLSDTVMPNGKAYYELRLFDNLDNEYHRVESNRFVMIYNIYSFSDSEYVKYDLKADKGEILLSPFDVNSGFGVFDEGIDNNNLLGAELEWKEYREVYIDTTVIPFDTIWTEIVDTYWPRITQGFGLSTYAHGLQTLVGAVINGIGYGTLVGMEQDSEIPSEFTLYQNFPNPFNPSTIITYQLPKIEYVTLKIYNSLGKEVAILEDRLKEKGRYTVSFDASNLPSGVYFYALKSGSYSSTKKMLLIK